MIFEGEHSVIEAIKEKKRLKDEGLEHDHIKPMLFIDGGLMKGAYGVGAGLALEELGYGDIFTSLVGVSSGAPSAAYFVSKETRVGASLMWEECCSRKFINVWRIWNQVDTFFLSAVLRGVTGKGINTQKVFSSPTEVYIAVANFETGEPELLKPKNDEELFTAIQASILMPNVSSDKVKFNDIRYVDGGFTRPHSLMKAIDVIDATHILFITNQDKTITTLPKLERFLNHTIFRHRMPKLLRFAAHERKRERIKAIEYMDKHHPIPHALIWGDHSIRSMERDKVKVTEAIEKSRQWWLKLMSSKER
ncbi:patatin-like phospholipase family protein [Candidatus Nomurabacteria bacterium]|nr:patatin-like phospholipase family protein [Candidatus Nomurabacteria bacterium]